MISSLRLNQRKRQSYFVQRESQRKKVQLDHPKKVAPPTTKEWEEIRKKIAKQKKKDLIRWLLILPPSILITYLLLDYLIG